jgi:hypothetical protein
MTQAQSFFSQLSRLIKIGPRMPRSTMVPIAMPTRERGALPRLSFYRLAVWGWPLLPVLALSSSCSPVPSPQQASPRFALAYDDGATGWGQGSWDTWPGNAPTSTSTPTYNAVYRPAPARQSLPHREGYEPPRPVDAPQKCLADLGARFANFTPLVDQYYGAGCGRINSVKLLSLTSDNSTLAISNLGIVTCPLANAFAGWARFGVDRAARQILGSPLVRIETLGSYNCRNVAGTNARSGHATGNAIDVAGFELADGRHISLLGGWNAGTRAEQEFLRVVHQSACKRFGEVLGPDFNPAHRNHFHLEMSASAICR